MPAPESATWMWTPSAVADAESLIVPPSGVCRSAFEARFWSACSSRCGSPRTSRSVWFYAALDGDVPFPNRRAVAIDDASEEVRDRHILERQRPAASLEPGQFEQIADELLELLGFVADDRRGTCRASRHPAGGRPCRAFRCNHGWPSAASSVRARRRPGAAVGRGPTPPARSRAPRDPPPCG